MAKKKPATKRNPNDATNRNVRAANKRIDRIAQVLEILADRVYRLEHPELGAEAEPTAEATALASEPG